MKVYGGKGGVGRRPAGEAIRELVVAFYKSML